MFFDNLIEEYKAERLRLKKLAITEDNKTIINSIIRDLNYSIKYMSQGFPPDKNRGVHRRAIPVTDKVTDLYGKGLLHREDTRAERYSPDMLQHAHDIYFKLSKQEKKALWLVRVKLLSLGQAAQVMGVSKGTVQDYLDRAKVKIEDMLINGVQQDLFDVG